MSLQALGAVIGVTYQQVQKYETGQNRLGGERLEAVAHALEIPARALDFSEQDTVSGPASSKLTLIMEIEQFMARMEIDDLHAIRRITMAMAS